MMDLGFKIKVFEAAKVIISEKIEFAMKAMQAAQEAANTEEKSSMGDKYETGRAMSQLAKDMNAKQMLAFQNELDHLKKLSPNLPFKIAQSGALVQTEQGWFYIAAAIGLVMVDGTKIMVLSPESPLGKALAGKKSGNFYEINGRKLKIQAIF